ncbi:hypothetical protein DLAC_04356 [Tieghemostelium lacteum]|uniref:Uncharacterized protein n=1 Tax=Tieghemostelium lacteum TaxID=361077 RepID=A0A151ZJ99_TIELA|nr:hypothetical protein DLAC_04356 [Tieghemostelium lacteum]|eukprot:KYQ94078.1 hypothetical protein DLAC_04356 [Tieghemostelium lacteum]
MTTTFVKPTILPNIIIKDILEYILNRIDDFEYLIDFIHRYTLISKKWNEEIIGKLKVNNRLTTTINSNYEIIKNWVRLADRYKITFELKLKNNGLFDLYKLIGVIGDKVVTFTNLNDKLTKSDYNYYKNLKEVGFWIDRFDSGILLSEFCDNIKYKLELSYQKNYQEIPENITEIVFNQNLFTRLKISRSVTITELGYHNQLTQLRHFNLEYIKISKNAFSSILSRSPNLEKLSIDRIILLDCTFDIILQCIADISIKFQNLSIVLDKNISISVNSVLDLLNRVQCKHVDITFFNIKYSTKEEITSAVIDNTSIEKFRFTSFDARSYTNNKTMVFDLFSIWKDKSNLKDIAIGFEDYITEMVNLEKLEIRYIQGNRDELEKYINPTKLPKLKELKILVCNFPTIDQILKINPNITKMKLYELEINEFVSILDSQQFPTLSDLFIEIVRQRKKKCEENVILSAFQNNTTLRWLKIRNYDITMENPQSFLMSIVQVNRSYISLIVHFGPNENYSEDKIDYNLLDEILSNNTTIKKLFLPSTITIRKVLYNQKLIHIFNKYSVIRVTYSGM